MIVCPFKDLKRYTASIPGLEEAVAVMAGITDLTPRTIPLSGDNRIIIQSYTTKLPAEGRPEAHREFLDIQYVVEGEECVGWLIYFFEYVCGLSGYLLEVNPFDQPGVEAYKKNMFALLGKPGYEAMKAELEARL